MKGGCDGGEAPACSRWMRAAVLGAGLVLVAVVAYLCGMAVGARRADDDPGGEVAAPSSRDGTRRTAPAQTAGPGDAELSLVAGTLRDARDEFERTRSQVLKGDFAGLASRLLDNGRVVDPQKAEREKDEFRKALEHERQVFKALDEATTEPGDFRVAQETLYRFPSLDGEGRPEGVSKEETVTVTFRLAGSGEVGRVHFPRRPGRGVTTVAEDGTLIVVMKKLDGRWYWNPFGW